MKAERWQQINDLFQSATERAPEERAAFLDEACQGDKALCQEVESLLASYERAENFIETPAFKLSPELLLDNADALIGRPLGHYRIDAVLGVGGMGVVYLARDEKLGRKVGLKLLPPSLVGDKAQLERLKREARTASALNHPNIVTIHEIGEVDSIHYIATEFIEGITLRERIAKGPIPPNEALEVALQVASALCVAHEAGVVHRDIKPENIMLRRDGYVKVLDFGIAKFTQPKTSAEITPAAIQVTTHPGMILGTMRYLSPEQARGRTVDARTDVWSLGVVLYEMLAGRAPFEEETPTDIMAAVLMKEPLPLGRHGLVLPEGLDRIVAKALQKEKEARYQSAGEMLDDLRQAKHELDLQEKSGASTRMPRVESLLGGQTNALSIFAELKRRNVYKVAVAYAVIGWLVMQVAATVVPALHLPDTITTTAVVLTLLGFPIALIFAWAFELTPEGIRRSKTVVPEQSMTRRTGRALNFIVLGALLLVIALFVLERRQAKQPSPGETLDKSIAVLPFENRSDDKANAYFAEGVQDEILTRLSKIADLRVISHTSTEHYTSAPENVPEIAKQLGVVHILRGSVQKSGDSVRVNVQLIRAASDSRVWAETFDRKLTDLFSVQSEVAKAIAEQLRAKLTGLEEQLLAVKPTNNPEAYDAYLRGLAYAVKTARSSANDIAAQKYLREAIQLDPKFALSWAMLSYVDSIGYVSLSLQPTNELREEARQAAETALKLDPNLGEALVANGYYHYACLKDYDTAERYFEQARRYLPNDSLIPETLAYVARRRGQWDRSESFFNQAERIDPRNVKILSQHALSYIAMRRFSEALQKVDQILNITPDDSYPIALKASIAQLEGDLPRAAALLAPLRPKADNTQVLETQAYQAILERHPEQLIAQLREVLANPDPALGYNIGGLRFYLGWAQEVAGDHAAAQESWQQARSELEPLLKEQSRNYLLVSALAFSEMGLGDKMAALQLAESAMAGNPMEKDAVMGARPLEIFARVAAQTGETDRAIAAIEKLLSVSYGGIMERQLPLTPSLLRLDPMFDPLRNDPRFQKLANQ